MTVFERFRAFVDIVARKDAEIETFKHLALAANRASLDLAVAWSISLERPEVDVREDLDALICNLSDQIAKIEEHVV